MKKKNDLYSKTKAASHNIFTCGAEGTSLKLHLDTMEKVKSSILRSLSCPFIGERERKMYSLVCCLPSTYKVCHLSSAFRDFLGMHKCLASRCFYRHVMFILCKT